MQSTECIRSLASQDAKKHVIKLTQDDYLKKKMKEKGESYSSNDGSDPLSSRSYKEYESLCSDLERFFDALRYCISFTIGFNHNTPRDSGSKVCFCPCGKHGKLWREQRFIKEFYDCKSNHLFRPEDLIEHLKSKQKDCIYHEGILVYVNTLFKDFNGEGICHYSIIGDSLVDYEKHLTQHCTLLPKIPPPPMSDVIDNVPRSLPESESNDKSKGELGLIKIKSCLVQKSEKGYDITFVMSDNKQETRDIANAAEFSRNHYGFKIFMNEVRKKKNIFELVQATLTEGEKKVYSKSKAPRSSPNTGLSSRKKRRGNYDYDLDSCFDSPEK